MVSKSAIVTVIVLVLILTIASAALFLVLKKREADLVQNSPAASALSMTDGDAGYTDMNGEMASVEAYVGQVLVVNSWASWCPFCANELQKISAVVNNFSDPQVQVLAINRSENAVTAERFINTTEGLDGVVLILDAEDKYYKSIEGYTMPETVIYNREGNIVFHKHGEISEQELQDSIRQALETN